MSNILTTKRHVGSERWGVHIRYASGYFVLRICFGIIHAYCERWDPIIGTKWDIFHIKHAENMARQIVGFEVGHWALWGSMRRP